MILLPWHNDRGNNVWSLAMNKIAWQTVYLPRHNGRGNNTLGNKILAWQYRLLQWHCSWQMSLLLRHRSLHVPPLAMKVVSGKCLYCHDCECCDNVLLPCLATDAYGCKKPQHLQRQTSNGCNTLLQRDFLQPLATNVIWLQHLPFATKLGLLQCVGAKSDQQVNIYSFAVCCDRMWPSTPWHRIYTGLGNMPYVQFQSIGDFIPEPRCSKFAMG